MVLRNTPEKQTTPRIAAKGSTTSSAQKWPSKQRRRARSFKHSLARGDATTSSSSESELFEPSSRSDADVEMPTSRGKRGRDLTGWSTRFRSVRDHGPLFRNCFRRRPNRAEPSTNVGDNLCHFKHSSLTHTESKLEGDLTQHSCEQADRKK